MRRFICVVLAICLLAGLFACVREELPEETSAETTTAKSTMVTTEMTATQFVPEPFQQTIKQRIHKSLPEFEFTLYGNAHIDADDDGEIYAIEISGKDFHQRLDAGFIFMWSSNIDCENYEFLFFEDYTNDGFLDFKLYRHMNRNGPSMFWIWDKDRRMFIESKRLREINASNRYALSVLEDGRLYAFTKEETDKGISWSDSYYGYIDGDFELVEKQMSYYTNREDIDGVSHYLEEVYKLIDGKMKLVSSTRKED